MVDLDKRIQEIEAGDAWDESDDVVHLDVQKPQDKVIPVACTLTCGRR